MEKKLKRIISIMLIVLLLVSCITHISYAQTAEEELKTTLTEFKDQLGNLNQFKEVVDEVYIELNAATEVTPELKENLKKSLSKLREVEGINPLIADVLVQELEGQVNVLTNETLTEMKSEIKVIKEWVDEEIKNSENDGVTGDDNNNDNNDNNDKPTTPPTEEQNPTPPVEDKPTETPKPEGNKKPVTQKPSTNTQKDPTQSQNKLPNAGQSSVIAFSIVIIGIIAIISILKYKKFKEIK